VHAAQLLIVVVPRSSLHWKVAGSSAEKVKVAAPSEVSPGPVSMVTFGGVVSGPPPPPEAGKLTIVVGDLEPTPSAGVDGVDLYVPSYAEWAILPGLPGEVASTDRS
jgi:hypothetical protein